MLLTLIETNSGMKIPNRRKLVNGYVNKHFVWSPLVLHFAEYAGVSDEGNL